MNPHLHVLKGCAPVPLANYLKALGILRLVGEQVDPQARAWWEGERFCLLTKLSKEELEAFFLEHYAPTPLLSPWNAGSGFYRTWDAKAKRLRNSKNAAALDSLLASNNPRIESLRNAVQEVHEVLPRFCQRIDVSKLDKKGRDKLMILPDGAGPTFPVVPKDDTGKLQVQRILLRQSRRSDFYHAALVEVEGAVKCPWLFGSGGNDGNIDYTGRFFENLKAVLFQDGGQNNRMLLQNALYDEHVVGFLTGAAGKIGQFLPSAAGGANTTTGFGSQSTTHLNPWDFLFSLEGGILFIARATRRLDSSASSRASAPFAVRAHAAGFATPGSEKAQRGEQWMPIWHQPATLHDVSAMFGEARIQLDRKTANRPVDVARAISRLGVARGIVSFIRYGYLERNGQSTLAVPLGRIAVQQHPLAHLVDDLSGWMNTIERHSRDKNSPGRLASAERRLADTVFAALTHDHSADRWQAILLAAADIEAMQATGTAINAGPIPSIRPEWVAAVDDGSAEVRLALALGSAAAVYVKGRPKDPVRFHWLPLEPNARRFKMSDKRLVNDPRVIATGRDPVRDLAALVERRLIESGMKGHRESPLVAARGCGARLEDLTKFLEGSLDVDKLAGLARAFMAIRWNRWNEAGPSPLFSGLIPDEPWLAIRLTNLPGNWINDKHIPAEPRIVRLLMSGDSARAIDIACNRIRSAGIRPPLQAGVTDPATARRWAAALAFPIDWKTANMIAQILDPRLKPKKGLLHA